MPVKAQDIQEYYLHKLKEAQCNAQGATCDAERGKWHRIAQGYHYLTGLAEAGAPNEEKAGPEASEGGSASGLLGYQPILANRTKLKAG